MQYIFWGLIIVHWKTNISSIFIIIAILGLIKAAYLWQPSWKVLIFKISFSCLVWLTSLSQLIRLSEGWLRFLVVLVPAASRSWRICPASSGATRPSGTLWKSCWRKWTKALWPRSVLCPRWEHPSWILTYEPNFYRNFFFTFSCCLTTKWLLSPQLFFKLLS